MSSATAFWAAGKEIVATPTPTTPAPAIQTPTMADALPKGGSEPTTQQSNGLVSKSKTNDHKPNGPQNGNWVVLTAPVNQTTLVYKTAPVIKRACWADEEDDDDDTFLTQSVTQPTQTEMTRLEKENAVKEEGIKKLEEVLATKTLRIAELEGAIRERDAYIDDLEHDLQKRDNEIEELKQKNHEQYVEIQELHCEVGEKDDHIKRTEAKLEPIPTTEDIKSLILHSGSSTTSDDTKVSFEMINTSEAEVALPKTPEPIKTPKVALLTSPKFTKSEGTTDTQKTDANHGPAFSDSTSPTFVTKETLKEGPPVPKPKKLTFPIDLSKYGKKHSTSPAASPATKPSPASRTAKNGETTPWVHLSKSSRTKTDVKPVFKPLADIRKMSFEERALFGNGPDVTVKLGDVALKTLPQYILMQCSSKAMEYFKANPKATSWKLPEGSMDAEAARAFLNWMHEMTYQGRVYSIALNTSPTKDEKNLRICRAARVLGVKNTYIGHFTKQFCDRIRAKEISCDTISAICEQSYPDNDPVLDCLANNLVDRKIRGSAEDKAFAEKVAARHPVLKAKMDNIEKRVRTTRRK